MKDLLLLDAKSMEASTCTKVRRSNESLTSDIRLSELENRQIELKSLILAQIERWRNALHMQVERQRGGNPGGERRTGE